MWPAPVGLASSAAPAKPTASPSAPSRVSRWPVAMRSKTAIQSGMVAMTSELIPVSTLVSAQATPVLPPRKSAAPTTAAAAHSRRPGRSRSLSPRRIDQTYRSAPATRNRSAPIRKTGMVSIASRIPRYVDPQTTYTTRSAAQIRAAPGAAEVFTRLSPARPPAPPVAIVQVAIRQRERQKTHAEDDCDHEHTCHNEDSVPVVRSLAQIVLSFVLIMQTDGWLGLELRHLLALKAVAEEGSFGRAAHHLGYTQSAISQQIATLERIVGQKLLERPGGPRPVSLTEAGTLLLRHSDAIAARLRAAQADLAALEAGEAGPLRVGTYQSVSAKLLPTLLREFHQEWPKVEIRLTESADDFELLTLVEQGELDLTFVAHPIRPGPFETAELPRISYRSCRITQAIEDRLRVGGREPNIVFRSDDNGTVQALVAAGVGIAVVPRLTINETDVAVAMIDLGDRVPPRQIGIAWHRDRLRTHAAEAFVEASRALCTRIERETVASAA